MMNDQIIHVAGSPGDPPGAAPSDVLIELVVQRLTLGQDVAAVKYASRQLIDDPVREKKVLQSVAHALNRTGLYQKIGRQFFRDQIEANKVIQRGLHQRWYAHPQEVPAMRRDLAAGVRPKLDRITRQMMRQFECIDELPYLRLAYIEDLVAQRYFTELSRPQLPQLHRSAAVFALRSFAPHR
jgi:chorismate mutase